MRATLLHPEESREQAPCPQFGHRRRSARPRRRHGDWREMSGCAGSVTQLACSSTINRRAQFRPCRSRRPRSRPPISVTAHRVRLVWLLDGADVLFAQLDVERTNRALEMLDLGGTDDWGGDTRFLQQPCQGYFGG